MNKSQEKYKIGLLIPSISQGGGYWKSVYDGVMNSVQKDYPDFSIELFEFPRTDYEVLSSQFQKMISCTDLAAYIIAPIMQDEIMLLLSKARPLVPYCFIDSPLPNTNPLCTVAQNPFKAGFLLAKLTRLFAVSDGTFAVIKSHSQSFNINERVRGFASFFVQNTKSRVVQKMANGAAEEEVVSTVVKLLNDYEDLRGICMVSSVVCYVGTKIAALGLKDKIAVTGFDLLDKNVSALKSGYVDCLISQDAKKQGSYVMKELYKNLVLGQPEQSIIDIPINVVFKENI